MGVVELVVLVFSLCLVAVAASDVTCESEYRGTCNLTSNTCYHDHQYDPCISNVYRSRNHPLPQKPNCGVCPQQSSSGYEIQPRWVIVTASTYDSTYFNVHVSWDIYDEDSDLVEGFRVRLGQQRDGGGPDLDVRNFSCVCLNASHRNFTFTYNRDLQYKKSGNYELIAQVMMLPLVKDGNSVESQEANTKTNNTRFPSSCRDLPYDPIHCEPPEYGPPKNVHAYSSTLGLGGNNSEEMSIRVSWGPPQVTSPYPKPTVYYVQVQDASHDLCVFNVKTNNTHSVSIHHLNASLTYNVNIVTYVPCCAGGHHGCSFPSNWVKVVPEPSSSPIPMLPTTMSVSSIIISTVTASPTATPLSRAPPSGNNITEPIVIASSIAGVLILAIFVAVGIVIASRKCFTCRSSSYDSLPQSEDRQIVIHCHPPQTRPVRAPPPHSISPNSRTSYTVLVVYSPDSSEDDEKLILQLLVRELRKRYIDTVTPKDLQRGNLPLWMEDQMKRADAVLCVCNEAFSKEWNKNPETTYTSRAVVHSLKAIIGGSLSQSKDLSTFLGIVLLKQSDKRFIPSNYLAGTQSFLVDETEDIARFVAQVPHFEVPSS